jgi:threonine aldolase
MPDVIDLRSDTVTKPTPAMRRAMAAAEVGDDVFEDDPTVQELEARAADLLGKEAGLFVASGTMGNLVSQMAHVPRGGEIIADARSHTVIDEAAGHAVVVGASIRTLRSGPDGTMDPADVRSAFRDPRDVHEPITALIVLENTHAHSMGQPLGSAYTTDIAAIAHEQGIPLHIDGARFFNAVVALRTTARELAAPADSVTFCLSKGLGCPVGSVVVGSREFIGRARRARKLVGGGMRQVGVLAAAGLVALRYGPEGMIDRLAEDHEHARILAHGLAAIPGVSGLDPSRATTDFVIFRVPDRPAFLDSLARDGVLMVPWGHHEVRAVTHYGIERTDVERTIQIVARTLGAATPAMIAS